MSSRVRIGLLVLIVVLLGISLAATKHDMNVSEYLLSLVKTYYPAGGKGGIDERLEDELLDNVGDERDAAILAGEFIGTGEALVGTGDGPATEITRMTDKIPSEEFLQLYEQAISSDTLSVKITIAKALYEEYGYEKALPILVQLLISARQFDTALSYIQGYTGELDLVGMFGSERIIQLMFNSLDLNFKNFNRIKAVVDGYASGGYLSQAQKSLYYGLITLAKGDLDNYAFFMNELKGTSYHERYERYIKRESEFYAYENIPEYYLLGLLGVDAYVEGRYQVAESVASEIIRLDENYILGYQLHAYSHLMLGNRSEALPSLRLLQESEEDHAQLYLFLEGIALFEQGQYADSTFLFLQIDQPELVRDAKRYTFLAYHALGNTRQLFKTIRSLIGREPLIVHDYYTMFSLLLYRTDEVKQLQGAYTKEEIGVLTEVLRQCYDNLENSYAFVCLYGKAGLLLEQGDSDKARAYLERLVEWYKKPYLYEQLGDIYLTQGDFKTAKKRYVYAIQSSVRRDDEFESVRSKLMTTVLELK